MTFNSEYVILILSERRKIEMRVYAIQRKADKKIVFSSASRKVIFERFNRYYNRETHRIVILERG